MKKLCLAAGVCIAVSGALAEGPLKVSEGAWTGLTPEERSEIQAAQLVEVFSSDSFGTVIDTQGLDQSAPATSAGAALGSSFAEAAYIDRAFKPENSYSAKNQLAMGILGAVIGSTLDTPATQQFQFRYALRRSDGEVQYRDSVQSSPFRHPVGMCLNTISLDPLPQSVCNDNTADLRRKHLRRNAAPLPVAATRPQSDLPAPHAQDSSVDQVTCKLGNLQPIQTSADKCRSVGGVTL